MQEKNVLNKYKEILGQYCAINQFVELAKRCFIAEHTDEVHDRNKFVSLATHHSITLTDYNSEKMVNLISKSYIVNIHLCFETFVKEVCTIVKKYGTNEFKERQQDESYLKCAVNNIANDGLPKEIQSLFALCEYYRLIRNSSVHDLCDINEHTKEYSGLSKYDFKTDAKFKKLSAPNPFENISFDDFVMFARSSIELATYLFENISYDYKKIILAVPQTQKNKWKNYCQERREQAIYAYIKSNFSANVAVEEQLPYLASIFEAQ